MPGASLAALALAFQLGLAFDFSLALRSRLLAASRCSSGPRGLLQLDHEETYLLVAVVLLGARLRGEEQRLAGIERHLVGRLAGQLEHDAAVGLHIDHVIGVAMQR